MGRLFFIPILTLIINIYPLLFRILKSSFICTCWKDSLLPCGVLLFPFASFCYWRTFSLCCWWCSSSTATKNFYQRHLYTLFLLLLAFTGYVYFCFFFDVFKCVGALEVLFQQSSLDSRRVDSFGLPPQLHSTADWSQEKSKALPNMSQVLTEAVEISANPLQVALYLLFIRELNVL